MIILLKSKMLIPITEFLWLFYLLRLFKIMDRRRKWQPTPVFLPGKVHGQRNLAGCSPWGYMIEHACMRVEGDGLVKINCCC